LNKSHKASQAFDFGNIQDSNICAIHYYFSETLFYRMYTAYFIECIRQIGNI